MTSTKNIVAKTAAVVAGLGLVASTFAVATPASAQTTTQLQAQIAALQAQIAALQAQLSGGASVSVTYTRDLTIGSTGADVTALQTWLISKGFSIPAGATGYFGVQTRAAVAAFQAANGIAPAAGYFGPITRARVIAMIGIGGNTGGNTGGNNGGALQGGAGRLTDVEALGDIESDLDAGEDEVRVLGFEATADDSDVAVQRVDVRFTIANSGGSSNLSQYVDEVALFQGDRQLASMDAEDGDKDGREWTYRFADLNGIIREGDTENFYVVVTPVSSIGSNEMGDTITVEFEDEGVRAVDAAGVSETYDVEGDGTNDFSVNEPAEGDLSLSESNDNPDNTAITGDLNDETDDVTLLAFNARARNQDITINDIPVGLTVTGETNVGDVVQRVALMRGDDVLDSKTITGTGASTEIVFDNLDEEIEEGDTEEYTVVATIRSMASGSSGTAFDQGDTIVATTSSNSGNWDAEDADGNVADISGSVTGGTITFNTTGITVSRTDASYTKTVGTNVGEGDRTQYSISFRVTAGDEDLYIDRSVQNTTSPSAAGGGVAWATTTSSNSGVTDAGVTNLSASDTNNGDTATSFKVPSGTTRTFTLNVTLTATGTGYSGVRLTGINYDTDSNTNDSTLYYTSGLDTFKTADVSMVVH